MARTAKRDATTRRRESAPGVGVLLLSCHPVSAAGPPLVVSYLVAVFRPRSLFFFFFPFPTSGGFSSSLAARDKRLVFASRSLIVQSWRFSWTSRRLWNDGREAVCWRNSHADDGYFRPFTPCDNTILQRTDKFFFLRVYLCAESTTSDEVRTCNGILLQSMLKYFYESMCVAFNYQNPLLSTNFFLVSSIISAIYLQSIVTSNKTIYHWK